MYTKRAVTYQYFFTKVGSNIFELKTTVNRKILKVPVFGSDLIIHVTVYEKITHTYLGKYGILAPHSREKIKRKLIIL